jgi:hypothetical protein
MQKYANQYFRPGVFASDGGHVFASDFFGVGICHWTKLVIGKS